MDQLQQDNNSSQPEQPEQQSNVSSSAHQQHQQHEQQQQNLRINQDQATYYQQDVRKKKHPEIQPYVPSDRFPTTGQHASSLNSNNKLNQQHHSGAYGATNMGPSRLQNNKHGAKPALSSMTSSSGNSSGQPRKFVSMTRLNQLAQPRKRPTTNTNTNTTTTTTTNSNSNTNPILSSNSSTKSINSINRTLEKRQQQQNQEIKSKPKQHEQQRRLSEKQTSSTTTTANNPARLSSQNQNQQQKKQPPKKRESLPRDQSASNQKRPDCNQQQQQQEKRNSNRPQPITPIANAKPTTMITPLSPTSVMISETPQSSTPVSRNVMTPKSSSDKLTTPQVQPPTPASSLEEELETATKVHRNDLTRDILNESASSIADQVSEMSVNDPFYQSAASELVPDSENSTNGITTINYNRNADSLCREFEQDLLAKGIVISNDSQMSVGGDQFTSPLATRRDSDKDEKDDQESIRRNSAVTIVTSTSDDLGTGKEALTTSQATLSQEYDEDDRRLIVEKELRERAQKEEDDRKQREQLVSNILSRFSQGSTS